MTIAAHQSGNYWLVGARHAGEDLTSKFLDEGRWENFGEEKHIAYTKSMRPGDPIAIKSVYTRKNGPFPFENNGNVVSVMAIKATGTIRANPGDGYSVEVDWNAQEELREWYFFTFREAIWRVVANDPFTNDLVSFTFEGTDQNLDIALSNSYWRDRYSRVKMSEQNFSWTKFYQAFADKLLDHKNDRTQLVEAVNRILTHAGFGGYLTDHFTDGSEGPLTDICPFTVFGTFNRGITHENRIAIAKALGEFLGVSEPAPTTYDAVPILNNMNSWFFRFHWHRDSDDIDKLWDVFEAALLATDGDETPATKLLGTSYDDAESLRGVGWKLTIGLFWIRPWNYPSLDSASRAYMENKLGIPIGTSGSRGRSSAGEYLDLAETLSTRFLDDQYSVHSFPELSQAAWMFNDSDSTSPNSEVTEDAEEIDDAAPPVASIEPYSIDNILADGCFIEREEVQSILDRLRTKKNLILQGPPGTGKTWLARRLAFALIGEKSDHKVRAVQFHPNLSYEDFVRGWRPGGDGTLVMSDGPFLEMVERAKAHPETKYAVVIEEINRGNPAQIFGELLTLLESDKRNPEEALELTYGNKKVYIPSNLYVIGTMNLADRSLALVDLALRRRFAFIDLSPSLGTPWLDWSIENSKLPSTFLKTVRDRIDALNVEITADATLGKQFCLGHSFVTPRSDDETEDPASWFEQVVRTEIGPQLDEYWFDAPEKARAACTKLLEGLA
jgi:5-methylcytosine-specific restriction enzyme B